MTTHTNTHDDDEATLVAEVKKTVTKKRLEIKEEKAKVDALGEETDAIAPLDLPVMYAGKLCILLVKMKVRASNILSGYMRKYGELRWNKWSKDEKLDFFEANGMKRSEKVAEGEYTALPDKLKDKIIELAVPADVRAQLKEEKETFLSKFEEAKKKLSAKIQAHPLWDKMKGIKGFTAYQLGLVMSYIKDVKRFENYSQLSVYAGLASITDPETGRSYPVTKANINIIKQIYLKTRGKEFNGFNTELSGRMFAIADCLLRSKGFFYQHYLVLRQRLEAKAKAEGKCELVGEGEEAKWMMKNGNKNQSLVSWSNSNAKRRIMNLILYFIWNEWRQLEGVTARDNYVFEILGHTGKITLADALKADAAIKKASKSEASEEDLGDEDEGISEDDFNDNEKE